MATLTYNLCSIGIYTEGDICPVSKLQSSLLNSKRMWEWEIPIVLPLGRIDLGNFKQWNWTQTFGRFILKADAGKLMWNPIQFKCFGFSPERWRNFLLASLKSIYLQLNKGSATERIGVFINKPLHFSLWQPCSLRLFSQGDFPLPWSREEPTGQILIESPWLSIRKEYQTNWVSMIVP